MPYDFFIFGGECFIFHYKKVDLFLAISELMKDDISTF